MRNRLRTAVIAISVAAVGALAAPSGASAAVSCLQDGFLQPFVTVTGGDAVAVSTNPSGQILFDPGADGGYVPCGSANLDTTITLTVNGEAGSPQGVLVDLRGGRFVPGFEDEPGFSDEVEISVNLRGGSGNIPDALWVRGHDSFGDRIQVGASGINLNIFGTSEDTDADILFGPGQIPGVIKIFGGEGDDSLIAHDTRPGDGDPIPPLDIGYMLELNGEGGDDVLAGSHRTNTQAACVRQDTSVLRFISFDRVRRRECLIGGFGEDDFWYSRGDEMSFGDSGDDHWRVPICCGGELPERRIEDPGDDKIRGGSGSDLVEHDPKDDDDIEGGSGPDRLMGGPGRDHVDGGGGFDRCSAGPGRDRLRDCERDDFRGGP
jgi:Ca2+-binding RTX toxin-like protein